MLQIKYYKNFITLFLMLIAMPSHSMSVEKVESSDLIGPYSSDLTIEGSQIVLNNLPQVALTFSDDSPLEFLVTNNHLKKGHFSVATSFINQEATVIKADLLNISANPLETTTIKLSPSALNLPIAEAKKGVLFVSLRINYDDGTQADVDSPIVFELQKIDVGDWEVAPEGYFDDQKGLVSSHLDASQNTLHSEMNQQ